MFFFLWYLCFGIAVIVGLPFSNISDLPGSFWFPGVPPSSFSARSQGFYVSNSFACFHILCLHLGPNRGQIHRGDSGGSLTLSEQEYSTPARFVSFRLMLSTLLPLPRIAWGLRSENGGEKRGGFLYIFWEMGVPFPISQARTRRLLLELSLSIFGTSILFWAALKLSQGIPEEKNSKQFGGTLNSCLLFQPNCYQFLFRILRFYLETQTLYVYFCFLVILLLLIINV